MFPENENILSLDFESAGDIIVPMRYCRYCNMLMQAACQLPSWLEISRLRFIEVCNFARVVHGALSRCDHRVT